MEKQLLVDHIPHHIANLTLQLNEGQTKDGVKRMTLIGKIQQANVKNGNGRVYPKEILEREIKKYIEGPVKQRTSLGELDHPDSSVINLANASHIITRVWWEGDSVYGELELLNTPAGKIAQEIILAGIPLGISSRALGSVQQLGETVEVQDDLELIGLDLVSIPSTPGAYLTLKEGKEYNNNINKYHKVNQTITDILCSITGVCEIK